MVALVVAVSFFFLGSQRVLKATIGKFIEVYFYLDILKRDTSAFEPPPRMHLRFHHTILSSLNCSNIAHGYDNNRHYMVSILTMMTSHTT